MFYGVFVLQYFLPSLNNTPNKRQAQHSQLRSDDHKYNLGFGRRLMT
jgi:hypothetical protein